MKIYVIRRLAGMVVPLPTRVGLSKSKVTDSRSKNYNFRHGNFKNAYRVLFKGFRVFIFIFFVEQSGASYAVEWYVDTDVPPHLFPSPKTACEAIKGQYSSPTRNLQINPLDMYRFECLFQILLPYSKGYTTYQRVATMTPYVSCDEVADVNTGRCRGGREVFSDKEVYKSSSACAITPFVGNPVSVSSGNKFQNYNMYLWRGHDGMPLSILYNSRTGLWRHNFSSKIVFDSGVVLLLGEDGSVFKFQNTNGVYVSRDVVGELIKTESDWLYRSSTGFSYYYNNLGQLSRVSDGAHVIVIERSQDSLALKMDNTESVQLFEDGFGQLTKLISNDGLIDYKYDDSGHLLELHKVYSQGAGAIRRFEYGDVRDPKLLTGITDERSVRYAIWSYDDQGRAISSEHAGGAEKVTLAYNDDGSTTVTNALGKQTTYRFQVIQGVKRITAIEGEPSADCPAANSTYTYNDRGQVVTATDAEGRVTRYAYNNRGLEISRIEGEGTAEARTVTTEWDPELYRRTQVTADGRRTLYSYDDQGRLLSERTEAVSAN